jgi:hypothetical protein
MQDIIVLNERDLADAVQLLMLQRGRVGPHRVQFGVHVEPHAFFAHVEMTAEEPPAPEHVIDGRAPGGMPGSMVRKLVLQDVLAHDLKVGDVLVDFSKVTDVAVCDSDEVLVEVHTSAGFDRWRRFGPIASVKVWVPDVKPAPDLG